MFTKALYYPHIHLPDNAWLRRAILYWDQVNPIVPHKLRARAARDPVFRRLAAEGLSEPKRPEDVFRLRSYKRVMTDLQSLVSDPRYRAALGAPTSQVQAVELFADKVDYAVADQLRDLGLMEGPDKRGWLRVEPGTARLYMGYLAAAIAQSGGLEPLTDEKDWEAGLLSSQLEQGDREQALATFVLEELIPAPRADVGVAEIVAFRQKHEEELLRFRRAVRGVCDSLKDASDGVDAARKLNAVKDEVREQSLALDRKLNENRIATRYSTLEVSMPIVAALLAVVSVPLGVVLAGADAVVRFGRRRLDGRIRADSLLAENPYTYVYRVEGELAGEK